MGHKVSPISWRLGINKTWDSEWTADYNRTDYSAFLHQDLYIKEYINNLAKKHYIQISKCQIRRFNKAIKVIVYTSIPVKMFKQNSSFKVKKKINNIKNSIKDLKKRINIYNCVYIDYFDKWKELETLKDTESQLLKKQHYALNLFYHNEYSRVKKMYTNKANVVSKDNVEIDSKTYQNIQKQHIENISNLYKQIQKKNKEFVSYRKQLKKKYYLMLFKKKLKQNLYLLTGFNIQVHLIRVVSFGNSALLLATFIAEALKKHKFKKNQRNSYKRILKQYQVQAMRNKNVQSVKIKVSGRLNGIDRARHFYLSTGNMNINSISCPVDYAFVTIKTKYGVIGIKVWIYKKSPVLSIQ